jgi:hypothetical protein
MKRQLSLKLYDLPSKDLPSRTTWRASSNLLSLTKTFLKQETLLESKISFRISLIIIRKYLSLNEHY